jgi:hypothetical protein
MMQYGEKGKYLKGESHYCWKEKTIKNKRRNEN